MAPTTTIFFLGVYFITVTCRPHSHLGEFNDNYCPETFHTMEKNITNCSFEITNDINTLKKQLSRVEWKDGTVQHINFTFVSNKYRNVGNRRHKDTILPSQWLMAYINEDGPYFYVSWRTDFKVFSFGLLNDYENPPLQVKIIEKSTSCAPDHHRDSMTRDIVVSVSKFLHSINFLNDIEDYENVKLCHLTRYQWFDNNSVLFWLKKHFGIPLQEFGYECCIMKNTTVCCESRVHNLEGYRIIPYIIGIIIFSVIFIFLMVVANLASVCDPNHAEEQREDLMHSPSYNRMPSDSSVNDKTQTSDNSNVLSIKKQQNLIAASCENPALLGITAEFSGCCSKGNNDFNNFCDQNEFLGCSRCTQMCSTLTDGIYSCCNTSLCSCTTKIFTCYSCLDAADVPPTAFKSDKRCRSRLQRMVFLILSPICIYIELVIYYVIEPWRSIISSLVECDVLFGFTSLLGDWKNMDFMPLAGGPLGALIIYHVLGLCILVLPSNFEDSIIESGASCTLFNLIGSLHPRGCSHLKGYRKVERILSTCMFLSLNPKFWKMLGSMRYKLCSILIAVIILPILAFPFVQFSAIVTLGWINFVLYKLCIPIGSKRRNGHAGEAQPLLGRNIHVLRRGTLKRLFKIFINLFIIFFCFVIFTYFSYVFIVVMSYSCYVFVYTIYFIGLAFVTSPKKTSHYIAFISFGIIFFCQIIRDSLKYYKEMFKLTVEVCQDHFSEQFIRITNGVVLINKEIAILVQKQIHSIFIEIGHLILKLAFVCLIYTFALFFINKCSEQIPDYMEHFTVGFIVLFPLIIQFIFKKEMHDRAKVHLVVKSYVDYILYNKRQQKEGNKRKERKRKKKKNKREHKAKNKRPTNPV